MAPHPKTTSYGAFCKSLLGLVFGALLATGLAACANVIGNDDEPVYPPWDGGGPVLDAPTGEDGGARDGDAS